MGPFTALQPSIPDHWRAIILFGRNVASYKFALGHTLLELASKRQNFVTLEELAIPFARHICSHLQLSDRQGTFKSSRFLDACRKYSRQEMTNEQMQAITIKQGFENVIDAFHVVGPAEIGVRFFHDERKGTRKGIALTDTLLGMFEHIQQVNLPHEIEARWRLVETAWALQLPVGVLKVSYDPADDALVTEDRTRRRIVITRVRPALNGYQKGKCFYCFDSIDIASAAGGTDVDHFLPHRLKGTGAVANVDGVWNLVLS